MSSNKDRTPNKRRDPELRLTAFIASSALSTRRLNAVASNRGWALNRENTVLEYDFLFLQSVIFCFFKPSLCLDPIVRWHLFLFQPSIY